MHFFCIFAYLNAACIRGDCIYTFVVCTRGSCRLFQPRGIDTRPVQCCGVVIYRVFSILFGKEVRSTLREAANQLSNKLSHAQHLDEVTWTTKNWHGLQMQRLSVVLHTAVAWQTVNELACGESGIVHGAECIAVLNGVA